MSQETCLSVKVLEVDFRAALIVIDNIHKIYIIF